MAWRGTARSAQAGRGLPRRGEARWRKGGMGIPHAARPPLPRPTPSNRQSGQIAACRLAGVANQ